MESLDLIKSGIDISQILIQYLAKDAMGADFLKNYLTSQNAQTEVSQKQQASLKHLIEGSNVINEETKRIATKALENNDRLSVIYNQVEKLRDSIESIEKEYKRYNEQFTTIISQTHEINKLIDSIKDISAQTNLLSFNASIEAARAGVAGKGFRVIANEVKKLSDDTNKTSETIKTKVTNLVKSISDLEKATNENTNALVKLTEDSDTTLNNFDNVRKINSDNNSNVSNVSVLIEKNIDNINQMINLVNNVEEESQSTVKKFAKSASENEMLFNDLYSFAYEIKAIFEKLNQDR